MICFVSSHTGGHLMPALALADRYEGQSVLFSSKIAISNQLVRDSGVTFVPLKWNPRKMLFIGLSILECMWRFLHLKPHLVVASGGVVCVPVLLVARFLGIPYVLLEQNVLPGRVTRWFAKSAKRVFLGLPLHHGGLSNAQLVGNPLFERRDKTGLVARLTAEFGTRKVLLVMGGSQGARAINDWIRLQYEALKGSNWVVVHLAGSADYLAHYADPDITILRDDSERCYGAILPFFDGISSLYELADAVVTRAGATSISECMAYQRPMLMVPYPYAKDNHQQFNAEWAQSNGFGKWVSQTDLPDLNGEYLNKLSAHDAPKVVDHWQATDVIIREIDGLLN